MLSRVKEFHGPTSALLQGFLAIAIWMVALIIFVAGNLARLERS